MKTTAICLTIATLIALSTAKGEEPTLVRVWPGSAPGVSHETKEAEFTDGGQKFVAGKPIYLTSNISSPELVYYRVEGAKNAPVVIVCPGGGHRLLAYDLEGTEVAQWLNGLGIHAVILKYRVPSTNPDMKCQPALQDAQRSIRAVRSKASEWGVDPNRIGILGFSAGGEVAARASLQSHEKHYSPVDAIDELDCKPNFTLLIYPAYLTVQDELRPELDPRKLPSPETLPEFFLVHTWDDAVTPLSSICLAKALKQVQRKCELHLFDRGGHGYGIRHVDGVPVTDWTKAAEPWLKNQVANKLPAKE